MKTLKKTLCLVLAVVMAVGVLILPANATFKDIDNVTSDYKTAITKLEQYGILQGNSNGYVMPDQNVTRAEVATMVYRIMTGDTAGKRVNDWNTYAGYQFNDKFADWQKGPVGYCANGGFVKGIGDGTFAPNASVTGYELAAMLLRAIGYGKNHEFEGSKWMVNTINYSEQLKIFDNVKTTVDLSKAISREVVAQIVYNAIKVPRVDYYNGKYSPYTQFLGVAGTVNVSLVMEPSAGVESTQAVWGAPSVDHEILFTYPVTDRTGSYNITPPALYDSWVGATECDVASAMNVSSISTTTYTNGLLNVDLPSTSATDQTITSTNTTDVIGAQGRHTLIYANPKTAGTSLASLDGYIVVYIDTFLAEVVSTTEKVTDPAGHTISAASATLKIYSNSKANPTSTGTITIDNSNGTYAVGDIVRIQLHTKEAKNDLGTLTTKVTLEGDSYDRIQSIEKITPVTLTVKSVGVTQYVTSSTTGAVSKYNGVAVTDTNGVTYKYNYTFGYNTTGASRSANTLDTSAVGCTYNFYLDSKGNILGIAPATVNNYGVITAAGVQIAGVGQYYNQYVIKTASGDVTVNQVKSDGTYFNSSNAAEYAQRIIDSEGRTPINTLVYYAPNPVNPAFVNITVADYTGTLKGYTGDPAYHPGTGSYLPSGKINMLSVATSTNDLDELKVNNNTVFFVANYDYSEHTQSYYLSGYSVYTGFTSVPDLALYFGMNGLSVDFVDLLTGADVGHSKLEISAFDVGYNGQPSTRGKDGFADYVFVEYANSRLTPQKLPTVSISTNYAFLLTENNFADVSNKYWSYNAVIEGVDGNVLNVAKAGGSGLRHTSGLYTYDSAINDYSYVSVTGPINQIKSTTTWEYAAGVLNTINGTLTKDQLGNTEYLSVTPDAQVYLINPVTGTSTLQSLSILEAGSPYAYTTDSKGTYNPNYSVELWYQYNEYGLVDLIYVVARNGGSTPSTGTTTTTSTIGVTSFEGINVMRIVAAGDAKTTNKEYVAAIDAYLKNKFPTATITIELNADDSIKKVTVKETTGNATKTLVYDVIDTTGAKVYYGEGDDKVVIGAIGGLARPVGYFLVDGGICEKADLAKLSGMVMRNYAGTKYGLFETLAYDTGAVVQARTESQIIVSDNLTPAQSAQMVKDQINDNITSSNISSHDIATKLASIVKYMTSAGIIDPASVNEDTIDEIVDTVIEALGTDGASVKDTVASYNQGAGSDTGGLKSILSDIVTGLVKGVTATDDADSEDSVKAQVAVAKAYIDWLIDVMSDPANAETYGYHMAGLSISGADGKYTVKYDAEATLEYPATSASGDGKIWCDRNGFSTVTGAITSGVTTWKCEPKDGTTCSHSAKSVGNWLNDILTNHKAEGATVTAEFKVESTTVDTVTIEFVPAP